MAIGMVEQLAYSTVRIECVLDDGRETTATGFYVQMLKHGEQSYPVIVTSKHAIQGATVGRIHMTMANDSGEPILGSHQLLELRDFESRWILHPDAKIDLAILPFQSFARELRGKPFFIAIGTEYIPNEAERAEFSLMEDVVMIGYPDGIWDEVNNLPVVRKGITATHIKTRYNGDDVFLVDIASFPGSSGSPVLIVNISGYTDAKGTTHLGVPRVKLIGVFMMGGQHEITGERSDDESSVSQGRFARAMIPNNIGIVANSMRIKDFEPILRERIKRVEAQWASYKHVVPKITYGTLAK